MSTAYGEDVRAVANELLAISAGKPLTNLSLQKVIYFLHGQYLLSTGSPLVSGYFEAWEFGPVHPTLYGALRHLENRPLSEPLRRRSIHEGGWQELPRIVDLNVRKFIAHAGPELLRLTVGQLVDLSHAPNSPWDVVSRVGQRRSWGLRLDNDVIRSNFRFHKRSVTEAPDGEPFDERPPAGD